MGFSAATLATALSVPVSIINPDLGEHVATSFNQFATEYAAKISTWTLGRAAAGLMQFGNRYTKEEGGEPGAPGDEEIKQKESVYEKLYEEQKQSDAASASHQGTQTVAFGVGLAVSVPLLLAGSLPLLAVASIAGPAIQMGINADFSPPKMMDPKRTDAEKKQKEARKAADQENIRLASGGRVGSEEIKFEDAKKEPSAQINSLITPSKVKEKFDDVAAKKEKETEESDALEVYRHFQDLVLEARGENPANSLHDDMKSFHDTLEMAIDDMPTEDMTKEDADKRKELQAVIDNRKFLMNALGGDNTPSQKTPSQKVKMIHDGFFEQNLMQITNVEGRRKYFEKYILPDLQKLNKDGSFEDIIGIISDEEDFKNAVG